MNYIDDIITEEINSTLHHKLICEFGMKPNKMTDKFGEVLDAIVDNLVCLCLYPNSQAVNHWKERVPALCKRFVDIDIDPISKNKVEFRLNCLNEAVVEVLNQDYSAIKNHFKTVSEYYSNRPNQHDRLTPYKPYEECYVENAERIKNAISTIISFIAEQNYRDLVNFMETF